MKKTIVFLCLTLAFFLTACSNSEEDMIVQESPVTADVKEFFTKAFNWKEFLNQHKVSFLGKSLAAFLTSIR